MTLENGVNIYLRETISKLVMNFKISLALKKIVMRVVVDFMDVNRINKF